MNLVSIIVPVYNIEAYLQGCIDSIQQQRYINFEVILVDDGSMDRSGIICDSIAQKDHRFRVIHKQNGGLSSARNAGLAQARGNYIYFLDGDDSIEDCLLEKCVCLMNTGFDLVIFNYRKIDANGTTLSHSSFPALKKKFYNDEDRFTFVIEKLLNYSVGWEAWGRFFSADVIRKHHLTFEDNNKIFAEDLHFFFCYLLFSNNICCTQEIYYNYMIRDDSIMGSNQGKTNLDRMNCLSFYLSEFIQKEYDKTIFQKCYFIIHYLLLKNELSLMKKNGLSIQEIRQYFIKMPNSTYCFELFKKFVQNKSRIDEYYSNIEKNEMIHEIQFYLDGNYQRLRFSNRMTYDMDRIFPSLTLNQKKAQGYLKSNNGKRTIFLLGTEDFGNIGDHKIALSQLKFLKYYFNESMIFEVTASRYHELKPVLKRKIKKADLIFLTGGGNMGNLYPFSETIRVDVINTWGKNQIFIFPQTIYFDFQNDRKVSSEDMSIYNRGNITIMTREKTSYDLVQDIVSCTVLLYPDIVLYDNDSANLISREYLLLCLRSDQESIFSEEERIQMKTMINMDLLITETDLQLSYNIDISDRDFMVQTFIEQFQKAKIVITDRLHGMIFAAITGTPCIAVDNLSRKVSGVYEWIKELPYIRCVQPDQISQQLIEDMLLLPACEYDKNLLKSEFDRMADKIREICHI